MIGNRELTIDDYLGMLRRRLKIILIPTLVAPLLGFAISYAFTPKYTSESLVLVEEQKVPENYVKPVVTEDLTHRIATLQQKALGADRLRPLVEKLSQQGVLHSDNINGMIEAIRAGVAIEAVDATVLPNVGNVGKAKAKKQGNVPAFNVSYTGSNPREAQAICAGFTDILLQENLRERAEVAQNTSNFLGRQVDDAKHNLDELDARLAAFKKQYMGQLPGDEDSNLKILTALNSQLDAETQAVGRAQQDRAFTESLLAQQLNAWKSSQNTTNPQTLQQQLAAAQAQLITLEGRYTDDHPDVVKAKKDVEELKKKLDEVNSAAANTPPASDKGSLPEPPEIRQLRVQIHQYDEVIAQATTSQKKLEEQIKFLQGRVALSPTIEEQYKQLTRDYDTAQKFYNDLLANKSQSEMQTVLEREQQGEQMQLQIPANFSDSPSFPNRLLFAGGGLGGGLVLGLGLGLWLELRDQFVRTESDVLAVLELPVLSQFPWVEIEVDSKNGSRKRAAPSGTHQQETFEV